MEKHNKFFKRDVFNITRWGKHYFDAFNTEENREIFKFESGMEVLGERKEYNKKLVGLLFSRRHHEDLDVYSFSQPCFNLPEKEIKKWYIIVLFK